MKLFKRTIVIFTAGIAFPLCSVAEETTTVSPIPSSIESSTTGATSMPTMQPMADDSMSAVKPMADENTAAQAAQDMPATADTVTETTAAQHSENLHRAQLATNVINREPVDEVASVPADIGQLFFFTEVRAMNGQTITHRWERNGEVMAEVNFNIGGDRWRVYSRKSIKPDWTGQWTVTVVDDQGQELTQQDFTVEATAGISAQ